MPLRSSRAFKRWRALRHSRTASSRARTRSRTASSATSGTHTAVNSPARASRASMMASRRSVLTRSPERLGIDDGATTSQARPCALKCRQMTKPHFALAAGLGQCDVDAVFVHVQTDLHAAGARFTHGPSPRVRSRRNPATRGQATAAWQGPRHREDFKQQPIHKPASHTEIRTLPRHRCSNSRSSWCSRILASNGLSGPPCGVPTSLGSMCSPTSTPARRWRPIKHISTS